MSPTPVPQPAFEPIPARGLTDDVYDTLLDMLTAGVFEPDAPLYIDRLARSLQVSPTPVREALARLESTGLISRTTRRGYRVAPPMSATQMRELVEARLVLEAGALERALEDKEALVADLRSAWERHRAEAEKFSDPTLVFDVQAVHEYFEIDWSFHQAILDHCGNRYINRSVNALSFSVHRMRQTIGAGATDAPIAVAEHAAILRALEEGRDEDVLDALASHLRNVAARSTQKDEGGDGGVGDVRKDGRSGRRTV